MKFVTRASFFLLLILLGSIKYFNAHWSIYFLFLPRHLTLYLLFDDQSQLRLTNPLMRLLRRPLTRSWTPEYAVKNDELGCTHHWFCQYKESWYIKVTDPMNLFLILFRVFSGLAGRHLSTRLWSSSKRVWKSLPITVSRILMALSKVFPPCCEWI